MKNKLNFGSGAAMPPEPITMGGYRVQNEERQRRHWFATVLRELTPKHWSIRLIDALRKHLKQQ